MKLSIALSGMLALSGCGSAIPLSSIGPKDLQALASAGCSCMQKDPQHRWWSRESQMSSPCWESFDRAVNSLDVTEEPVAACGEGSEAAPLTVRGQGMPAEGATIYLRYAFNGCTAGQSEIKERAYEMRQKQLKAAGETESIGC